MIEKGEISRFAVKDFMENNNSYMGFVVQTTPILRSTGENQYSKCVIITGYLHLMHISLGFGYVYLPHFETCRLTLLSLSFGGSHEIELIVLCFIPAMAPVVVQNRMALRFLHTRDYTVEFKPIIV